MLTIVSAGVLHRGDRLEMDGALWLVEHSENLGDLAAVHLLRLGEVSLEEWSKALPGRVRVEYVDPRLPMTVLA